MIDYVFRILTLAVEGAIRVLRSDDPIDEEDRLILAKAAEMAAELDARRRVKG